LASDQQGGVHLFRESPALTLFVVTLSELHYYFGEFTFYALG
jgi:hypothetical protein